MNLTTNEQLLALRNEHKLKNTDIARLLHVTMYCVRNWFSKHDSINFRHLPENVLELLRYKLAEISQCQLQSGQE